MPQTGHYIEPKSVIFAASANAGDREGKLIPPGFYMRLVEDALLELNMDSAFPEGHKDYNSIPENLTFQLPEDCFDVQGVYVFNGDACEISKSHKVWHKKNYFTKGNGYIANDKGDNSGDPYFFSHSTRGQDKSLIRYNNAADSMNKLLFYNVVNKNLMISASCRSVGTKIHVVYASTGGPVIDAPIIPVIFKSAVEDFVSEGALRYRMANELSMIKSLAPLHSLYFKRLDKDGQNGSWPTAIYRAKRMSEDEKRALGNYLGRGGWMTGR